MRGRGVFDSNPTGLTPQPELLQSAQRLVAGCPVGHTGKQGIRCESGTVPPLYTRTNRTIHSVSAIAMSSIDGDGEKAGWASSRKSEDLPDAR